MRDNEELIYWVALADNYLIGSKTILKLSKYFGSLKQLFKPKQYREIENLRINSQIRSQIKKAIETFDPEKLIKKYKNLGIKPISIECDNYPKLLKEIPDPPAVLFTKGRFETPDELNIGVVGSRKYSWYGKRAVQEIVHKLAQSKITIVSGMALGIDSIAHKTTLEAHGRTIGVLANGLSEIYPSSNRSLAEAILAHNGAIVSEYPPGVPPYKSNFPLRNRIISGMSLGILVIEAASKSGTLLTAKSALDYNRELFAVPGSIFSSTSIGANNLIKYGAKLVNSAQDIVDELNIESKVLANKVEKILPRDEDEAKILKCLDYDRSIHVDLLAKKSGLKIAYLSSKLIFMEMKGMVKNIGANYYILI